MIAFIHIGKTGGLTIQSILASQYGLSHCDAVSWKSLSNSHALEPVSAADVRKIKWIYPNLECLTGHQIMPYGDLDTAFESLDYFALVRSPVQRMASAYQQLRKTDPDYMSFEAYCDIDTHRDQQCRILGGAACAETALQVIQEKNVFVGIFERFDESLLLLKTLRLNELHLDYKHHNVAPSRAVSNELLDNDRTLGLLEDANKQDQILYDKVTDDIFPDYVQQYNGQLADDAAAFATQPYVINSRNILLPRLKRKLIYEPAVRIYRTLGNG